MFFLFRREHKASMVKLRNLLDDTAKTRRHHKNLLNVQVTFLAWFAESMGFLIIFLGTFVLGHENNLVNFCMQTLTLVVYFNILPCVFLIKDSSELKINILDSSWYNHILVMFCCQYNKEEDDVVQRNVLENVHQEQNLRREEDLAIISLASIENGDEIGPIINVNISKKRTIAAKKSSTKMHMDSMTDSLKTENGNPDEVNVAKDRISNKSHPELLEVEGPSSSHTNDLYVSNL